MSPKTLTGLELELDDGPARESELFLVDGNNLAYRAYFALPEELATTEGFPTNALLGFTNMLFKLLADYKPKGVAVAWDTRPVHRHEIAEAADVVYKEGRRPMADLLAEQFPFFRPIVEAFGYRNLEFEGWEADDVIATLATRADDLGIKTTVVSTDRDAFQLVTDNVALMLAPPDRSELREMFRRFEFRNLLNRIDDLDEAVPALERIVAGTSVAWREGELPQNVTGRVGLAIAGSRFALAQDDGAVVGEWRDELVPRLRDAEIVAHDYKALPRLTQLPAEDTMIAAYLIEPGRPAYELEDLAGEYGVEALPEPEVEEETTALIRGAEVPRRLAGPLRVRLAERGSEELY